MQFSSLLAFTLAAVSVSAIPVRRDVDPGLVIDFGINRNVNPTGTGDCDGFNGVKIPCSCPPSAADYLASLNANVVKGFDVNNPGVPAPFPTGNSQQDRIIRLQTQISSLQNLFGPGKGCPAAATNWNPILADLIAGKSPATKAIGGSAPPPAAPAPPPPPPAPAAPAPAAGGVDPALVIDFGINRNVNPTGTGDCDGFNGVKIPCSCPPTASDYLASLSANVAKGFDVNNPGVPAPFPTGNSQQDRIIRLQTQISSLQNLFGPGKGCPAAATNWNPILADLIAGKSPATKAIGGSAPAPAAPAAAPAPPAAAPAPAGGVDPALVLQFGVTPNTNPTGTGDCDGLNGVKIPCSCPPSRDFFIQSLSANVAAGKQVNNPGLGAPFPTDGSVKSQVIRLQTQISSLQNLFGPGKGCPAAATNWNGILADLISRQ